MSTSDLTPDQKLHAAMYMVSFKIAPFLAVAINNLIPVMSEEHQSFGVTKDFQLVVGQKPLMSWTVEEVAWTLYHEVSHVVRKHYERAERLGTNWGVRVVNACMDAEINVDIGTGHNGFDASLARKRLPKGFCWLPEDLKGKNTKPGELWETYYAGLPQDQNGNKYIPGHKQLGAGHDPQDNSTDGNLPQQGGQCGSGATGVPRKGDPEPTDGQGQPAGRSEAEVERLRNQVAEAIQAEAAAGRGSIPGGWSRWAGDQMADPVIPWEDQLDCALSNGIEEIKGRGEYNYRRPSRRQAALGFGAGRPVLPAQHQLSPEVMGVVDTSGSMDRVAIHRSVSEAWALCDQHGVELKLGSCDAAIHGFQKIDSIEDVAKVIKGGGGTNFNPIFEMLKKMPSEKRPNLVIIFTDGDGPAPAVNPLPDVHTIFVLVESSWGSTTPYDHNHDPITWAEMIEVPRAA